ncbi:MAG: hypothetical protein ACTIC1_09120 [Brevibacterium sp.]
MTQSPTPGQQLLAQTSTITAQSPLAAADGVATTIAEELGGAANLVSADLEVKRPGSRATSPTAVITAVLPAGDSRLRTEVSASLRDESGVASVLRLAFITAAADSMEVPGALCPGSTAWNAELLTGLRADPDFLRLIETYDGTIGLSIGGRPVHIRCYREQVLEVVPRAVQGADFELAIPGEVFIDLVTSQSNSFMEFAMLGTMKSTGSGYEYLRMTSALVRIIDHARAIAGAAGYIGASTTTLEKLQVA